MSLCLCWNNERGDFSGLKIRGLHNSTTRPHCLFSLLLLSAGRPGHEEAGAAGVGLEGRPSLGATAHARLDEGQRDLEERERVDRRGETAAAAAAAAAEENQQGSKGAASSGDGDKWRW